MSHLRHCPKHKKKLPCPHCASNPVGRPKIGAAPLTPAERKARSRQKQKIEDAMVGDQHGKQNGEVSVGQLDPHGKGLTIADVSDSRRVGDVHGQVSGLDYISKNSAPATVERWLDDAVEDLIGLHNSAKCMFCDLEFPSTTAPWSKADLSEHLWLMFREGEKHYETWQRNRDTILDHNTSNPDHGLPIEPLRTTEFEHYKRLWAEINRVRKARKRARNIVTSTAA